MLYILLLTNSKQWSTVKKSVWGGVSKRCVRCHVNLLLVTISHQGCLGLCHQWIVEDLQYYVSKIFINIKHT